MDRFYCRFRTQWVFVSTGLFSKSSHTRFLSVLRCMTDSRVDKNSYIKPFICNKLTKTTKMWKNRTINNRGRHDSGTLTVVCLSVVWTDNDKYLSRFISIEKLLSFVCLSFETTTTNHCRFFILEKNVVVSMSRQRQLVVEVVSRLQSNFLRVQC